jgi:hypothetical protein
MPSLPSWHQLKPGKKLKESAASRVRVFLHRQGFIKCTDKVPRFPANSDVARYQAFNFLRLGSGKQGFAISSISVVQHYLSQKPFTIPKSSTSMSFY